MLDRSALFTELTRRNAVRQQAQLPLLDIPAEYERAVRLAEWKVLSPEHVLGARWQIIVRMQQQRRLRQQP